MIDLELQLLKQKPARLAVLLAYQAATDELAEQAPQVAVESDSIPRDGSHGQSDDESSDQSQLNHSANDDDDPDDAPKRRPAKWLPRIANVAGVDPQELSKIHGQLIAYGLLKCDLADRSSGMVYQLTATAKQVLNKLANIADDNVESDFDSDTDGDADARESSDEIDAAA